MPRLTKFTPKKTDKGWQINIPPKFSASGKRERHYYPSREKAAAAAKTLRERQDQFGVNSTAISPTLADHAARAAEMLEPFGISIVEAARRIVEIEQRAARSFPIEDVISKFTTGKDGMSESQQTAYRLAGKYLIEDFPNRLIVSITGEELQSHLDKRSSGAGGYNQRARLIKALWRWSAKPPRAWCSTDPIAHLEKRDVTPKDVGVLSAIEAEKLMRAAEDHFPDAVPAFAISLFTGMRRDEIKRLLPEDVTEDGINVPASNAKTKRRRFIQMNPPLRAWLKAYPVADTVTPSNWHRKERAVRRLAGWRTWSDLVDPPKPPDDLPEWPENALRHTAASVALALGKKLETLVFEHGHSGGLVTLKQHYIGRMPKSEARAIWALRPKLNS